MTTHQQILNLSIKDFELFIENKKKSSWRYRNENVKNLFWLRYQANSLVTFNKSKNFNKEILDFVNKSSPLLVQQLLIPNEELQRLNKPEPRIQTGLELRDIATSCIDISDGLFIDLSHILNCSKVGADVQLSDIPYSKTLQKQVQTFHPLQVNYY